jgi:hypothetical protein
MTRCTMNASIDGAVQTNKVGSFPIIPPPNSHCNPAFRNTADWSGISQLLPWISIDSVDIQNYGNTLDNELFAVARETNAK